MKSYEKHNYLSFPRHHIGASENDGFMFKWVNFILYTFTTFIQDPKPFWNIFRQEQRFALMIFVAKLYLFGGICLNHSSVVHIQFLFADIKQSI